MFLFTDFLCCFSSKSYTEKYSCEGKYVKVIRCILWSKRSYSKDRLLYIFFYKYIFFLWRNMFKASFFFCIYLNSEQFLDLLYKFFLDINSFEHHKFFCQDNSFSLDKFFCQDNSFLFNKFFLEDNSFYYPKFFIFFNSFPTDKFFNLNNL